MEVKNLCVKSSQFDEKKFTLQKHTIFSAKKIKLKEQIFKYLYLCDVKIVWRTPNLVLFINIDMKYRPYPRKIKPCLYSFLVIFCLFYSLKFGGISLILGCLYLREANTWEMLNLIQVHYYIPYPRKFYPLPTTNLSRK